MEFQLGAAVKTKIEKTFHDGVAGENPSRGDDGNRLRGKNDKRNKLVFN